jgi:hypothetical protein
VSNTQILLPPGLLSHSSMASKQAAQRGACRACRAGRSAGQQTSPKSAFDSAVVADRRTQDMAGDPFGLLLRQRIVFLGGEARGPHPWRAYS